MNQRDWDTMVTEAKNEFKQLMAEFKEGYLDERGQKWQEENELTQSSQGIPSQPLPNNLA